MRFFIGFWSVWFCCRLTVLSQYVLALQRCLYPRPVWSTWRANAGRMTKRSGRFCRPSRLNSVCLIPVCQCHCVQKSADMYRLCKRTETDDHILKHIKSRASLLRSKQLYLLLLWIEMFFSLPLTSTLSIYFGCKEFNFLLAPIWWLLHKIVIGFSVLSKGSRLIIFSLRVSSGVYSIDSSSVYGVYRESPIAWGRWQRCTDRISGEPSVLLCFPFHDDF